MSRTALTLGILLAFGTPHAAAQFPVRVSVSASVEGYSFDQGVVFSKVEEYAFPVGIAVPLGRVGELTISTGYGYVRLWSRDQSQLAHQEISGALDTQARLSWNVIPGRLVAFATTTVPTGVKTVEEQELAVLGVLSSDIIGFQAPSLGSGGSAGGGFGGAVPIGSSWSVGVGGTVRKPFNYVPIVGDGRTLKPGLDIRVRAGVEGSLARRTYLRVAGIFAHQSNDAFGDSTSGIGNRVIGYLSLNQGIGNGSLTLYAFDVYRGSAQLEQTSIGTAILPRGNLFAAGLHYEFRVTGRLQVGPRAEYRWSAQDAGGDASGLEINGEAFRYGGDVRLQLMQGLAAVLQGSGTTGFLVQGTERIHFRGPRGTLFLEWSP
ncbi:MAG: hypothetical protein OEO20_13930 [Gemmatimonadota bacterium]|nr:hypothetical protein [Gemmatimonadota bacterium]MDH3366765.1 hypothetical protein [Gemmatimonadota bacterium]MDH3479391.1 hypothetical protein [Gemmatimonadota bacterium]MDH3569641.1 hypothetical protein [Gemmatimonadota bacterium]MDH5548903.1 hypothetical protein [Gemmatimonadota bacterium]